MVLQTPAADEGAEGPEIAEVVLDVAVISGATFTNKSVTYYEVAGLAMVEGDIALGTVDEIRATTTAARAAVTANPEIARGVGVTGSQFRWPGCRIPYEVDPALPDQQRVLDAIAHWEASTSFRFPLRTAANRSQYPNYVRFTDAGGCWSYVGMQNGEQVISLGSGCTRGNAIHEIGHAVGLWHEQSREDRDLFVTINWQNIQTGMAAQFNQHIADGDDLGAYDYASIMHYPRTAFSKNGLDTIVPTDAAAQIGQRTGLSPGDLDAVRAMYAACYFKRPWDEPTGGFKKVRDATPFKKVRDDVTVKPPRDPIAKRLQDPKPARDPGPVKLRDPITSTRPVVPPRLGGLLPFSIATPHHAPFWQSQVTDVDAMLPGLGMEILEIEAALAGARAAAAQAELEAAQLQAQLEAAAVTYQQLTEQIEGGLM